MATVERTIAPSEPVPCRCRRCHGDVLLVAVDRLLVLIERSEVIESRPCPLCTSRHDPLRNVCWRCRGKGVIGEPLPRRGVALDHDGRARVFSGERGEGESVHRLHSC